MAHGCVTWGLSKLKGTSHRAFTGAGGTLPTLVLQTGTLPGAGWTPAFETCASWGDRTKFVGHDPRIRGSPTDTKRQEGPPGGGGSPEKAWQPVDCFLFPGQCPRPTGSGVSGGGTDGSTRAGGCRPLRALQSRPVHSHVQALDGRGGIRLGADGTRWGPRVEAAPGEGVPAELWSRPPPAQTSQRGKSEPG